MIFATVSERMHRVSEKCVDPLEWVFGSRTPINLNDEHHRSLTLSTDTSYAPLALSFWSAMVS